MAKLFSRRVIFALWLTFVGLWAERIMRAAWPLLSTLVLGVGVLLLAAPDLWLPPWPKLAWGIWLLSGLYGLWSRGSAGKSRDRRADAPDREWGVRWRR